MNPVNQSIKRFLEPLQRRIMLMLAKAVVRVIYDEAGLQRLQVSLLSKETRDQVERFQEYGFTSHPLPGAEAVLLNNFGNRDHPLILAIDDRRYRLRPLMQGEVALYTHEHLMEGGHHMVFKRGQDRDMFIGRDVTNHVGRDVVEDVGRDETITVGRKMKIEAGEEIELVCGSSRIVLKPDNIRLYTPDYEAIQT